MQGMTRTLINFYRVLGAHELPSIRNSPSTSSLASAYTLAFLLKDWNGLLLPVSRLGGKGWVNRIPFKKMRVLSIQSHVVFGHVGNKSATFPLQLLGYEVDPLNTVQFSNHTGYKLFKGIRFNSQHINDIMNGLQENSFLNQSHILVGYVGDAKSLLVIAEYLEEMRSNLKTVKILIDPVLGDDGRLYCPQECIQIYRDIARLADTITPNEYEAKWLSGLEREPTSFSLIDTLVSKLHALGPTNVVITSASIDGGLYLFCSSSKESAIHRIQIDQINSNFTGTGDLFAALLLAHLDKGDLKSACYNALQTMNFILKKTLEIRGGPGELAIVQCANEILNPPRINLQVVVHNISAQQNT